MNAKKEEGEEEAEAVLSLVEEGLLDCRQTLDVLRTTHSSEYQEEVLIERLKVEAIGSSFTWANSSLSKENKDHSKKKALYDQLTSDMRHILGLAEARVFRPGVKRPSPPDDPVRRAMDSIYHAGIQMARDMNDLAFSVVSHVGILQHGSGVLTFEEKVMFVLEVQERLYDGVESLPEDFAWSEEGRCRSEDFVREPHNWSVWSAYVYLWGGMTDHLVGRGFYTVKAGTKFDGKTVPPGGKTVEPRLAELLVKLRKNAHVHAWIIADIVHCFRSWTKYVPRRAFDWSDDALIIVQELLSVALEATEVAQMPVSGMYFSYELARLQLEEGTLTTELAVGRMRRLVSQLEKAQGLPVRDWSKTPEEKPENVTITGPAREWLTKLHAVLLEADNTERVAAGLVARKPCGWCWRLPIELGKMEKMMACSRCKVTFYCSSDCQKRDWKSHKTVCSSLGAAAKAQAEAEAMLAKANAEVAAAKAKAEEAAAKLKAQEDEARRAPPAVSDMRGVPIADLDDDDEDDDVVPPAQPKSSKGKQVTFDEGAKKDDGKPVLRSRRAEAAKAAESAATAAENERLKEIMARSKVLTSQDVVKEITKTASAAVTATSSSALSSSSTSSKEPKSEFLPVNPSDELMKLAAKTEVVNEANMAQATAKVGGNVAPPRSSLSAPTASGASISTPATATTTKTTPTNSSLTPSVPSTATASKVPDEVTKKLQDLAAQATVIGDDDLPDLLPAAPAAPATFVDPIEVSNLSVKKGSQNIITPDNIGQMIELAPCPEPDAEELRAAAERAAKASGKDVSDYLPAEILQEAEKSTKEGEKSSTQRALEAIASKTEVVNGANLPSVIGSSSTPAGVPKKLAELGAATPVVTSDAIPASPAPVNPVPPVPAKLAQIAARSEVITGDKLPVAVTPPALPEKLTKIAQKTTVVSEDNLGPEILSASAATAAGRAPGSSLSPKDSDLSQNPLQKIAEKNTVIRDSHIRDATGGPGSLLSGVNTVEAQKAAAAAAANVDARFGGIVRNTAVIDSNALRAGLTPQDTAAPINLNEGSTLSKIMAALKAQEEQVASRATVVDETYVRNLTSNNAQSNGERRGGLPRASNA